MRVRNVLIGVQLVSVIGGLLSAEYLRRAGIKARCRDLRQVRAMHDIRREKPIAAQSRYYRQGAYGLSAVLGAIMLQSLQSRHNGALTILSSVLSSGLGAVTLVLRYEFIKSDDRRQLALRTRSRIIDLSVERARRMKAA